MGSPEVDPPCRETITHLWVYLDLEADPATCSRLEAHLSECESCRRLYEFDSRFKQLLRKCCDPGPPPRTVVESLRLRLEATLLREPPASQD
jgi:mycothiol system anti-sigma-R factor